jgi:hypothetical protein
MWTLLSATLEDQRIRGRSSLRCRTRLSGSGLPDGIEAAALVRQVCSLARRDQYLGAAADT